MTKQHCVGCRDNYYNHSEKGGCWSFNDAKLVKRLMVPVDQCPPYKMPKRTVPSCYNMKGYSTVNPDALDKNGYWKH